MRALTPGAVDIDPISARQRRRRPPLRPADPASHRHRHRKNRIGDPAAPAARAGRTDPCSRKRAHHAARASRAKIPSEYG
jgi:hypothetical protein